ncbi:hypothetical protein CPJCM30710_21390 [Clostridium polyendosporum]|uniref:DUF58 domain-containing protein n=1 Tax=Clostridium polyendosporum TaxID=69208 RepID=A0A919S1D3_9CLOT|nr:DUF58 domain-containing protein [Clostridium polyendosporum]GIM29473.1 hypothetical protein CPJCM30710_21390 [Clostridium polyendosporum]
MIKINLRYVLFLSISFIFVYALGEFLAYMIFYMLLVPFILSFITIIVLRFSVKITHDNVSRYYSCGEKEIFSTYITSKIPFLFTYCNIRNEAIHYINREYVGDAITLFLNSNKIISNEVKFLNRGKYDFGKYEISFNDMFGIFQVTLKLDTGFYVKVYPRLYDINFIFFNRNDITNNMLSIKNNICDLYSIRDMRKYTKGDDLRFISWKVSAKLNELYVKNFDRIYVQGFSIFLDMNKDVFSADSKGVNEESLIDFCVSLSYMLMKKNVKLYVYINNKKSEIFKINNSDQYNNLLKYFLENKSEGITSIINYINCQIFKLSMSLSLGIITYTLSNFIEHYVVEISEKMYSIIIFYIDNDIGNEGISRLNKLGISCIEIPKGSEENEVMKP